MNVQQRGSERKEVQQNLSVQNQTSESVSLKHQSLQVKGTTQIQQGEWSMSEHHYDTAETALFPA